MTPQSADLPTELQLSLSRGRWSWAHNFPSSGVMDLRGLRAISLVNATVLHTACPRSLSAKLRSRTPRPSWADDLLDVQHPPVRIQHRFVHHF